MSEPQAAILRPKTLDAEGLRIFLVFEDARATKRPVAVLIGDEYHGFNR